MAIRLSLSDQAAKDLEVAIEYVQQNRGPIPELTATQKRLQRLIADREKWLTEREEFRRCH